MVGIRPRPRADRRPDFLTTAIAQQAGHASGHLLPSAGGALLLTAYALLSAALAIAFPLRCDIT
jgi:ABC-2 type transport system permease protein